MKNLATGGKIYFMVAILIALKKESDGLIEQIAHEKGFQVHYTGMGMVAAAQKTTEVICKYKPTRILNLGTAGSRHFKVGSLLECTQFSNRTVQLLDKLKHTLEVPAISLLPKAHCGSSDHIDLTDKAHEHEILDMEAFAMAWVCKKMDVSFNAIKYVTDDSLGDVSKKWQDQLKDVTTTLQKALSDLIQTKVIS